MDSEKLIFLARNLLRGLLWMLILLGGFYIFKNYAGVDFISWLKPVYEKPLLVFLIYSLSEIFFGIIPPEIFMMWGLSNGRLDEYITVVIILALISYLAGSVGFLIGRNLENTQFFKIFKNRVFGKFEKYLLNFGAFIIIVAALTPLPFSGVSMLVGSVDFPARKFHIYALSRFLRFFCYSYIIWEVNML